MRKKEAFFAKKCLLGATFLETQLELESDWLDGYR